MNYWASNKEEVLSINYISITINKYLTHLLKKKHNCMLEQDNL